MCLFIEATCWFEVGKFKAAAVGVALTEDIPQYGLKKGSIGTIVEYYAMTGQEEDGYSLEGLIFQDTVEVAESQIELPIQRETHLLWSAIWIMLNL